MKDVYILYFSLPAQKKNTFYCREALSNDFRIRNLLIGQIGGKNKEKKNTGISVSIDTESKQNKNGEQTQIWNCNRRRNHCKKGKYQRQKHAKIQQKISKTAERLFGGKENEY